MLVYTFLLFATFSVVKDTLPQPSPVKEEDVIRSYPETMPYPAVCDSIVPTDQYNCSNELIRNVIYENLRWPGPDICVEGMAVISFMVCQSGELQDFRIARDPGAGTGEEALRLVKLMAQQTSPWVPGTRGPERKPVEMQYHVPVKFRLE